MSSRFVRASKFRHTFAEPSKTDACYLDLDLSPVTGDHNYIRCSPKFFSVSARGGGGPVLVVPYAQTGKLPRGYPLINGHSAPVYDTAWSPFNDNMLATGSEDTTVKLWAIPEGGLTENIKDAVVTLSGHGKPVSLLAWHPTASGVLASVSKDPCVKLWDVEKGMAKVTLEPFGALIQDIAFSPDGSLLLTSAKDKTAKMHDPRAGAGADKEWVPHEGAKAFKMLFLGATGWVLTVGFTRQSKREMKVWDLKALGPDATPLTSIEVDQAAGVMMPFYDEDTRMLYLTGKGDGNVRFYEVVDEAPFLYPLSEHRTNVSTKGADMLPKRCLASLKCEVGRLLKLTGDSVEPISFIVPRKSESFQEDLFPDTYAGVPSLSADAWFGGQTAAPKKVTMDPTKGGVVSGGAMGAAVAVVARAPAPAPAPAAAAAHSGASGNAGGVSEAAYAAMEARVKAAEAKAEAAEAKAAAAIAAAAASGGGSSGEEVDKLRKRVAELEASEAKLKKAVAALSA